MTHSVDVSAQQTEVEKGPYAGATTTWTHVILYFRPTYGATVGAPYPTQSGASANDHCAALVGADS
jgi:hypothetical protein